MLELLQELKRAKRSGKQFSKQPKSIAAKLEDIEVMLDLADLLLVVFETHPR